MGRTGIVLYHGIDSGAELGEYGRLAEDAGFDSLWVTERYFHEETFSMLGVPGGENGPDQAGCGCGESVHAESGAFWVWGRRRLTG